MIIIVLGDSLYKNADGRFGSGHLLLQGQLRQGGYIHRIFRGKRPDELLKKATGTGCFQSVFPATPFIPYNDTKTGEFPLVSIFSNYYDDIWCL